MSRPVAVDADLLRGMPLPTVAGHADKDARGRVLVVAGGGRAPGAAVLTGLAALRAGAGKLQLAATAAHAVALAFAAPEALVANTPATPDGEIAPDAADVLAAYVRRADAVVVGPGMMDEMAAAELADRLIRLSEGAAFVLDAGAMTGLGGASPVARSLAGRLVLTPHAGEMAALCGQPREAVIDDPLAAARDVAASLQAVVIMKGATSYIVTPDGRAWRHDGGVVGLATSGSGDVLAGVIGGLLARGASPLAAAVWGVFLHARAGVRLASEIGPLGFLARELLAEIPRVLADCDRSDAPDANST